MVIFLFGGYIDLPNEHRITTAARIFCEKFIYKAEAAKRRSP
jgi:hypothetical protein